MKENERQLVDTSIVTSIRKSCLHSILDSVDHFGIGSKVMEYRDTLWETGNGTEARQHTLGYLVLILLGLEALPIQEINVRDEVMYTSWGSQVEIARAVHRYSLHVLNQTSQRSLGHCICLVLHIKELDRQISVKIDDCTIVEEIVEVLLLQVALALHDEVFREDITVINTLEKTVLSVELQIPGDDVEALVDIIYDEKLNKVLNAS